MSLLEKFNSLVNPTLKNAKELEEIRKKIIDLGLASLRMNTKIIPAIVIPLSIILCYLFIFKEKETPSRATFSVLLGCCLISPIFWYILLKIANYYYVGKIKKLKKRAKELGGL